MVKLLFFGSYSAYKYGGAEYSANTILNSIKNSELIVISGRLEHLEDKVSKFSYPSMINVEFFYNYYFRFINFFINSLRIKKVFKEISGDLLLAQLPAALAINYFKGPSVYFFRSENDLNIYRTHKKGFFRSISFLIKFSLEWPFFLFFCVQNRRAVKKAKLLVVNSTFMAKKVKLKFNKDSVVHYPPIDIKKLNTLKLPALKERKYIMMVGDDVVKGIEIFKEIAAKMQKHEFLLVGKKYRELKKDNITYYPFQADPMEIYKMVKLVLVPSIWEEPFGRVAVEAQALGIPVIVSAKGGLPETVSSADYVINDLYNVNVWTNKINWMLSDYEKHSRKALEYVRKFEMSDSMKNLFDEIYKKTGIRLESRI
ncbi:MAG: glycosyltransferase family 4 protein [Candidatus Omnitrophica bacterium]|nr:glycosyltransferase family 4 protein [Candidatus Omnitrophota bacterium]